jgi:hypothetical protein
MKRLLLALTLYSTGLLCSSYVLAYTLVDDPTSPTGKSPSTGSDTLRINTIDIAPGMRQQTIYQNSKPTLSCYTYGSEGISQTFCQ